MHSHIHFHDLESFNAWPYFPIFTQEESEPKFFELFFPLMLSSSFSPSIPCIMVLPIIPKIFLFYSCHFPFIWMVITNYLLLVMWYLSLKLCLLVWLPSSWLSSWLVVAMDKKWIFFIEILIIHNFLKWTPIWTF